MMQSQTKAAKVGGSRKITLDILTLIGLLLATFFLSDSLCHGDFKFL